MSNQSKAANPKPQKPSQPKKLRFVAKYRHAITGKMMVASEYGYKAWPFGKGK